MREIANTLGAPPPPAGIRHLGGEAAAFDHPDTGSQDDFDAFVVARAAGLVRSARALLRDPDDAEDVVQDVLVQLHRHWATVCSRRSPDAYVRRALVNACTSFWRGRRRRQRQDAVLAAQPHPFTPAADDAVADRQLLVGLLRRLPPRQRACIVLRHYEGLADAEIAGLLGVSEQTVRSNIHRGAASLRRALTEFQEPR